MASALRTPILRRLALGLLLAGASLVAVAAWAAPEKVSGGIRFTYRDPNATAVCWAGAFNSWSATATPMTKDDAGVWSVVVALPAGEQQYKFVVDTQWFADPENGVTAGEFGNSVVKVGADGGLVAQTATSNTVYSPKITISGRAHDLMQDDYDPTFGRYELTRPTFDIDMGFGIRISDLLNANVLTNINPQKEDVRDYNSRLNFKRGSLEFQQPDLRILAFNSEVLPVWDDPAHLVGNVGIYGHPFGYQRDGFMVASPKWGFDTQVLYADNSSVGGTDFPGGATFQDFSLDRGTNRKVSFESDAIAKAVTLLRTERRSLTEFALLPGQRAKISTTDVGDGGHSFGFGDGAENVFAASLRRNLGGVLRLGVLGRSDRGYHLGRLVLADATGDSTGTLTYGQTEQQWFAGGAEARLAARGYSLHFEYLQGARRLDLMDRGIVRHFKANTIDGTGIGSTTMLDSIPAALGQHYNVDRGGRMVMGAGWTFAEGDVSVSAEYERQSHRYPAWTQPPVAPAGLANVDHIRFENVDFQRALYTSSADLENSMDEWRLRWDRNWRYYVGRELKTSVSLEMTHFDYDPRTSWEYQMWFPTGNFWLEQAGQTVSVDRLTLLGEKNAYRLRPTIDVPIRRSRHVSFRYAGDFTGVRMGLRPRYAESVFQFGFDGTPKLRFAHDTRWVKYDAPSLRLGRSYFSQFTEMTYHFSDGIYVALGVGADPSILDPVTNDFGPIGRETYLADRNLNGFIAENDWLSLAPQISAGERALQNLRRLQFEAVVHF